MLSHRYQVHAKSWGMDLNPDGDVERRAVAVVAYAKRDRQSPNEVFNELVAMRLGQMIGIEIPMGIVVANENDELFFASCHILAAGGDLPGAEFDKFTDEKPRDACGVIVFDSWIGNTDRHDENLWYDYYEDRYFAFDHGRAFMGSDGMATLIGKSDNLAIRLEAETLANYASDFSSFRYWLHRIHSIPVDTIRTIIEDAGRVGIDLTMQRNCLDWLVARRDRLPTLFSEHVHNFPRYQHDGLLFNDFGA